MLKRSEVLPGFLFASTLYVVCPFLVHSFTTSMLSSAIVPLAMTTAALAVALPHGLVTSDAEWCQGLGGGAFDTAPNFTLAAYDITGQNSNSTGSPLVLTEASTDGSNVYMAFAVSYCNALMVQGAYALAAQ